MSSPKRNSKKASSLHKKLSYRKKPKGSYPINHTWSASTAKQCELDVSDFIVSTLPIEARIRLYEEKLQTVMEAQSNLSQWTKSVKQKGPPEPLLEGYVPISTTTKSRLPDFFFPSLSTKPKRRNELPAAKSSISSFLKKASDSISTSCNMNSSKRQQKPLESSRTSTNLYNQHRFSLTSSLNRLSLTKVNCNNMSAEEAYYYYHHPQSEQTHIRRRSSNPNKKSTGKKLDGSKNRESLKRPQSTMLPHSPSSVFLERLRSRSPVSELLTGDKPCQTIQSNVPSSVNTVLADDDMSPPSSPSSWDSVFQAKKSNQDFLPAAKHKISLANIAENRVLERQPFGTTPIDDSGETFVPLSHEGQQMKKKRASLLVTPSLSRLRLLSQKPQFLKRQSMLA